MVPFFSESILAPDLVDTWTHAWEQIRVMSPQERRVVKAAMCRLAYPCWSGECSAVTRDEVVEALRSEPGFSLAHRAQILAALIESSHQTRLGTLLVHTHVGLGNKGELGPAVDDWLAR